MQKKWLSIITIVTMCGMLSGCCISHEWKEATCTAPKTCEKCGKTEGDVLEHTWVEATCAEAKHCSVCGATEGETLEHTWVEATCAEAKHCSVCGTTEGEALEHTLTEANYQEPSICEVCGAEVGETLKADLDNDSFSIVTEWDKPFSYTNQCFYDENYATTGKITLSEFEIVPPEEAPWEVPEGYECCVFLETTVFDDKNAYDYGCNQYRLVTDYYNVEKIRQGTVNYNGIDYSECRYGYENVEDEWDENGHRIIKIYIWTLRPIGYDGVTIAYVDKNTAEMYNDTKDMVKAANENTVFFRIDK